MFQTCGTGNAYDMVVMIRSKIDLDSFTRMNQGKSSNMHEVLVIGNIDFIQNI